MLHRLNVMVASPARASSSPYVRLMEQELRNWREAHGGDDGARGSRAHVKCLHTMTAHRLAQIAAGDLDPSRANVVGQWALDALAAGEDAQAKRGVEPNT